MFVFVSGMITAGFLVSALFFFRFWKRTKDVLFAIFGVSFVLFAVGQAASLVFLAPHDDRSWTYLLRLAGYVLILTAIIGKNLRGSRTQ